MWRGRGGVEKGGIGCSALTIIVIPKTTNTVYS